MRMGRVRGMIGLFDVERVCLGWGGELRLFYMDVCMYICLYVWRRICIISTLSFHMSVIPGPVTGIYISRRILIQGIGKCFHFIRSWSNSFRNSVLLFVEL